MFNTGTKGCVAACVREIVIVRCTVACELSVTVIVITLEPNTSGNPTIVQADEPTAVPVCPPALTHDTWSGP